MQYLVDTGIWLRLFDRNDPEHATILQAMRLLRSTGNSLATCPQNIAEFWNVSTRPMNARGGYGQSVSTTDRRVQFIERASVILAESPAAYHGWRQLLTAHNLQGVAVHDARLVSMMQTSRISHIITLNARDFARYASVTAVTPQDLLAAKPPDSQP
ncbi:MAG: type II toxin-antitoxin system VapC family toxin [Planctomycetota bacterium]